ncbi:MAG: methyltransferase domain-containing protein [Candidatus Lokiarchaeota archaeon]|nr:methyltransferase domain-containing protein [Candidatus Lokiarchaeota archaeon]
MDNPKPGKPTMAELEGLGYYDFMAEAFDVPAFQFGGNKAIEDLLIQCGVDKGKKVLFVGCGTGQTACHVARTFSCEVTGVDIAGRMVDKARERAAKEGIQGIEFRMGDAYDLPFGTGTFDIVVTEFVSQFLDLGRAFPEFARVLKPSGFFGMIELYRDDGAPPAVGERLAKAEGAFQRLTGLPFRIPPVSTWRESLGAAGFDVEFQELRGMPRFRDAKDMVPARQLLGIIGKLIVYAARSKKLRERFKAIQEAKRHFIRDKLSRQHSGYGLFVAGRR